MKILANKNGFVLAHDEYYGDYCFGTEREIKNLSMPCNQYGTKKEISQKDVEQILDAAIKRAKHKLGRKIVGIFKTKDKDDLQILKEADFNIK
mgnify:CR=1 FL=1